MFPANCPVEELMIEGWGEGKEQPEYSVEPTG